MGKVVVKVSLMNRDDEVAGRPVRRAEVEALVDSGATLAVLSQDLANRLGLTTLREARVAYADGRSARRPIVAGLRIDVGNRWGTFEAVVEPNGRPCLLGQVVLETLDLIVDSKKGLLSTRPESPDLPLLDLL